MQFYRNGYVTGDPRIQPAAGSGIDRPTDPPAEVDVLIVGAGPAGMLLAAQLAQFPSITTRIVDRRPEPLAVGQADGIQARSVETFEAFGFAEQITQESYRNASFNFWVPDPDDPSRIVRVAATPEDDQGISEYPHLLVNQARVLDYFADAARKAPTRLVPDYGWEFAGLQIDDEGDHPVQVELRGTSEGRIGEPRTVRARYVVGADGARSPVREAIGRRLVGDQAMHAWAVLDILANTDFPDMRVKCAITSREGSILHIPREGGSLVRMYVDLGAVGADDARAVRATTPERAIERANAMLHPYSVDVKQVAWYSVYEVGHRLTDKFDDVPAEETGRRTPRVFIAGDACHTHSAKAGQGMNVSMQDGFNLGWKLASVLRGRSPESLLDTYSAERQVIAQKLIDFDKEWSTLMAKRPEEFDSPEDLARARVTTAEFPAGFSTHYEPSAITDGADHQALAAGLPIGRRFKSAPVIRVADLNDVHLGHHHRADGRWRIYAFADHAPAGAASPLADWADWLATSGDSPVTTFTPEGEDVDAVFDVKVVYQQPALDVDLMSVPEIFRPKTGRLGLTDHEKVYAVDPVVDVFDVRGISRDGAIVVVRPDQYVAAILPLSSRADLTRFFARSMTPARALVATA